MANLQYSTDLKAYALDSAYELTDGTSPFDARAEIAVNQQYQAVWLGGRELDPSIDENWWWMRKERPAAFVLNPAISDGTVAVVNGNSAVTFSQAPASSVAGRLFRVTGQADVFRVESHTGGSANAVLDTIYTGPSDGVASYKLLQVDYTLTSNVFRLVSPMRVDRQNTNYDPYKIHGTNADRMEADWPTSVIHMGVPEQFAVVTQSNQTYTVRFNRYGFDKPDQFIRVEYDYQFRPALLTDFSPSGTEEPVLPWEYRKIIADAAAFNLLTLKNDDMAGTYLAQAQAGLRDMAKENRYKRVTTSNETGQLHPREYQIYTRVLRTESGLIIG